MRALRVVGITEGGGEMSVVLEDSVRHERYSVPADEQLRAAARGDLTRLGQIAIELESQLRPREIQARIRAGASVEQVSAAAGVPAQKIERFAYPVLLERSRTAEVAQRAHPVRADGPDARMLADVVAHTFGLRGQEYHSAQWDSWKGEDGRWIIALSWRAGRSDNRAHWTFQPGAHGGTVTAVDEHAHDLVEGLPARPLRTVGPVIDMARPDEPEPVSPDQQGHELRAAASDTARAPWTEAGRVAVEPRPPARTAPEPRRPEPPARRPDGARRQVEAPAADRAGESLAGPTQRQTPATTRPAYRPRVDAGVRDTTGRAGGGPTAERMAAGRSTDDAQRGPVPDVADTAAPDQSATGPTAPDRQAADAIPLDRAAADPATPDRSAADPATPDRSAADPTTSDRSAAGGTAPRADEDVAAPQADGALRKLAEDVRRGTPVAEEAPEPAAEEAPTPAPPARRTKKGKPVMPSWDEVLLGVRSQR